VVNTCRSYRNIGLFCEIYRALMVEIHGCRALLLGMEGSCNNHMSLIQEYRALLFEI